MKRIPVVILGATLTTLACTARADSTTAAAERNTLLAELLRDHRDTALARLDHYRPLCDADGYPLVGNVVRKGEPEIQPSEICAAIRKRR